jgi:hypothetical protein
VEKVNAKGVDLTVSQVKRKVRAAIDRLVKNDPHLLKIDVNERSITHRLAVHLKNAFKGWDVDCEYNRNRYDTKKLIVGDHVHIPVESNQTDDEYGRTVYPDIIVHHRGTDQNLLVVEVKKTTSRVPNNFDLYKLGQYKHQLGYSHALFLNFRTGDTGRIGVEEEKWVDDDG